MPSVRKSTGRAVTPVRQPDVAAARQTQIAPPALLAFPLQASLRLATEDQPFAAEARLPPPDVLNLPVSPLVSPDLTASESRLALDEPPLWCDISFPALAVDQIRWSVDRPPGQPAGSPALADLRAILTPDLFEQEAALASLPADIRPDQIETVRRLTTGGDWLLTFDPGIGLEETVCLALRELFRLRVVDRAVLVAPASFHPAWVRRLAEWGPDVDIVRGTGGEGDAPGIRLLDFPEAVESLAVGGGRPQAGPEVLVLDSYAAFRRRGWDPTRLGTPAPGRRWVLSGGAPSEAEDWRLLHRFFHPNWGGTSALADIHERLRGQTLRQTRLALADSLPRRARLERWFELDSEQTEAYRKAFEHERSRLIRLGGAVNRTHVEGALANLKRVLSFLPGSLDGVKVRGLVDLAEEILASGSKLIVLAPPDDELLSGLLAVLEAHGGLRLDSRAAPEAQTEALSHFRRASGPRVMIADTEARSDGEPLEGATFLIHFSHEWNPAHRRRAEQRLFPDLGPSPPHTVFEFWVEDSIEADYFRLLQARGLLARDVGHETRPSDIEEKLTLDDWLRQVFRIGSGESLADRPSTGRLPGTGALREAWLGFSPERLAEAAEALMRALGFTQVESLRPPYDSGCDFLAWQAAEGGAVLTFVRCLRLEAPLEGRQVREAQDQTARHQDCVGTLLITTGELSTEARRLAQVGGGDLTLVDGAEFYRHLRVLGLTG